MVIVLVKALLMKALVADLDVAGSRSHRAGDGTQVQGHAGLEGGCSGTDGRQGPQRLYAIVVRGAAGPTALAPPRLLKLHLP